ncbi:MAG: winged helix-turn-helix transcriptional regulator [Candidatus Kaiserbacteria bacterium]|nr:MAG: winged helix-turn-helix transcriptional regulator [Candidatus Kaiserbacteria bacterium]
MKIICAGVSSTIKTVLEKHEFGIFDFTSVQTFTKAFEEKPKSLGSMPLLCGVGNLDQLAHVPACMREFGFRSATIGIVESKIGGLSFEDAEVFLLDCGWDRVLRVRVPVSEQLLAESIRAVVRGYERKVFVPPPEKPDERTALECFDGRIKIDVLKRTVVADGRRLVLSATPYNVLVIMARRPDVCFSREQLMTALCTREVSYDRCVDAHIKKLRIALGKECREAVETLSGVGYKVLP